MSQIRPTQSPRQRLPRQKDPVHLEFIRALPCIVSGHWSGHTEAAHVRLASAAYDKRETGKAENRTIVGPSRFLLGGTSPDRTHSTKWASIFSGKPTTSTCSRFAGFFTQLLVISTLERTSLQEQEKANFRGYDHA